MYINDQQKRIFEIVKCLDANIDKALGCGFADGISGISLLFAYFGHVHKNPYFTARSEHLLELALSSIDDNPEIGYSFSCGLTGVLWTIQHLSKNSLVEIDANELLIDSDQAIFDWSRKMLNEGKFDYLNMGLGGVIYLLEREHNPRIINYLKTLLSELNYSSLSVQSFMAWGTVDNYSYKYNLSLSHGQLSILSILSLYYKYGIEMETVKKMAFKILGFIELYAPINSWLTSGIPSIIYTNTEGSEFVFNKRLAWCYGDLGSSIALDIIGERFEVNKIREYAQKLAIKQASRVLMEPNTMRDSCLCHGFSGAAYLFKKWVYRSNNNIFNVAAKHCNDKVLTEINSLFSLSTYKFWNGEENVLQPSTSLLEGICGVALSLLTQAHFRSPKISSWDRALLLS